MEIEPVNLEKTIEQLKKLGKAAAEHLPLDIQPDRTERFDWFDQRSKQQKELDDLDR